MTLSIDYIVLPGSSIFTLLPIFSMQILKLKKFLWKTGHFQSSWRRDRLSFIVTMIQPSNLSLLWPTFIITQQWPNIYVEPFIQLMNFWNKAITIRYSSPSKSNTSPKKHTYKKKPAVAHLSPSKRYGAFYVWSFMSEMYY